MRKRIDLSTEPDVDVPDGYHCAHCTARGCKLWRPRGSYDVLLLCAFCASKKECVDITDIDDDGEHTCPTSGERVLDIGTFTPAVPMSDANHLPRHKAVVIEVENWTQLPTTRVVFATPTIAFA